MTEQNYCIVYSLNKVAILDIILPVAYICEYDKFDQPSYVKASAQFDNVRSFGIDTNDSVHSELLKICTELSITSLEKVYNKNKKKAESLSTLFANPVSQKFIQKHIDKSISYFLNIIKSNKLFICYNLQRKQKAVDCILIFSDINAHCEIKFIKSQTGINYKLNLRVGTEKVIPYCNDIVLLSYFPAVVIIKRHILFIENINAVKLLPFLKKETIFIPEKHAKDFFEKFVRDIISKGEIEAEGFEIQKVINVSSAKLWFIYDLFEDKWLADIQFRYGMHNFKYSDTGKRKSNITFDNAGIVVVSEIIRSHVDEENYINLMRSAGFNVLPNKKLGAGASKYAVIESVISQIDNLIQYFEIEYPEIEGKKMSMLSPKIIPAFNLNNDWFDLKGTIVVGPNEYPIAKFFKNIKNKDPFFKLEDGSYLLLPEELMATYSQIVKFAKEENQQWKLSKSHYTLLTGAENRIQISQDLINTEEDINYTPSQSLKAQLRPYQLSGVKWLIKHRLNNLGACLADDMGLGKTLQTIAALVDAKENLATEYLHVGMNYQMALFSEENNYLPKSLKALIILPASLVFNWYEEIRKYAPSLHVLKYTGASRKKSIKNLHLFDIILTSYQTVVSDSESIALQKFNYIVLDESQQIKNKESKVFKTVNKLNTLHKISLSGTPIENSLSDLWSQMEFINPSVLGSYHFFEKNYKNPIEKDRNEKVIEELKKLVDPFILRRTKEQVAKDLPELSEEVHFSEMDSKQAKLFEKEKSVARNYLSGIDAQSSQYKFHVLTQLLKLRQIANHPALVYSGYDGASGKFDDITNKIETIVKAGHKVLIFSSFLGHLQLVSKWLEVNAVKYVSLTGEMSAEQKSKSVYAFQSSDDVQVFLLSIKAGGTGLNLTAADYVFILDPWWNPFIEKQAIARAHRIGQTRNVMVTKFISKNSIEEKILKLQQRKKLISDDIIEIEDLSLLEQTEIDDLFI
jgi:non-specific serine/threonine protein kinase